MLGPGDLKRGTIFVWENEPYQTLVFTRTTSGRQGSTVKVKLRNLLTGQVSSQTFCATDKFSPADVIKQTVVFLYKTDNTFYFMDPQTGEQFELENKLVGEQADYLGQDQRLVIVLFNQVPCALELPPQVTLKVVYAQPATKGNTSQAATKKVKLESGLEALVPLFIKSGDSVSIDTTTGEYRERH